jgi:YfiH family protein
VGSPAPLVVRLAPGVTAAFTTRAGGVSDAPYASLDLALHVGDDESAVQANRKATAYALGIDADRVSWCDQAHGDTVATVTEPGRTYDATDGLVTAGRDLPLAVLAADCVPVLLADPRHGIVAAVHAGRRGLVQGVVEVAVGTMLDLGARREDVVGAVGPAIGPCCYEVGRDVAEPFRARFGDDIVRDGKLDLWRAAEIALTEAGVATVERTDLCTSCHPELFFSHRRDGAHTGRQGLIAYVT